MFFNQIDEAMEEVRQYKAACADPIARIQRVFEKLSKKPPQVGIDTSEALSIIADLLEELTEDKGQK